MGLTSIHVVLICASVYFLIAVAIVTCTSFTSNWYKRTMLDYASDKRIMVLLSGFLTMAEILSKPFTQVVDWWSDVAVLVEMSGHCQYHFYAGVAFLLLHQIASAAWIYWDKKDWMLSLFQLLNIRVLQGVYKSAKKGRPVYELKEIRTFEASFEAVPQFIIQFLFILQCETSGNSLSWTQCVSIVVSIYTLANVFVYTDIYGANPSNSCLGPNTERFILKAALILIRMLEIWIRMMLLILVMHRLSILILLYFGISYVLAVVFVVRQHQIDIELPTKENFKWMPSLSDLMKQHLLDMIAYVPTSHIFIRMLKIADVVILFALLCVAGLERFDDYFIQIPVGVMVFLIVLVMISARFDVEKYKNGMRRNVNELIESKNIDVIFLLLERRAIPIPPAEILPLTCLDIVELFSIGIGPSEFREAGHDLCQLQASEFRDAGYGVLQLLEAGFYATELQSMQFNVSEFQDDAKYGLHQLLEAGFDGSDLRKLGYYIYDFEDAGYDTQQLFNAGFLASEFRDTGYSVLQLREAGCQSPELQRIGFNTFELREAGYELHQLQDDAGEECLCFAFWVPTPRAV